MLIDRVQPPLWRQLRKDADLRGDHPVGSHRQVILGFQIDKSEQRNDKSRKYSGHQQGPPQRRRVRELSQVHGTIPPTDDKGALHFDLPWRYSCEASIERAMTSSTWVHPERLTGLAHTRPAYRRVRHLTPS